MQKPIQIPGRGAKWILRIMVGGFITLAVAMISFILVTWYLGSTARIRDLELQGEVVSIRQVDPHDTKWFSAALTDGKSIVLEDAMLGVLAIGDSLFKKKRENFYTMKQKSTGTITRIRIIQP